MYEIEPTILVPAHSQLLCLLPLICAQEQVSSCMHPKATCSVTIQQIRTKSITGKLPSARSIPSSIATGPLSRFSISTFSGLLRFVCTPVCLARYIIWHHRSASNLANRVSRLSPGWLRHGLRWRGADVGMGQSCNAADKVLKVVCFGRGCRMPWLWLGMHDCQHRLS